MVERILGKDIAEDIFRASIVAGLMQEKKAYDAIEPILKEAGWMGDIASGLKNIVTGAPSAIGWTMGAGAASGVLGASLYDIVKERVSHEDPEEKFNSEVEAMYSQRARELEDAEWMAKVRAMRDDLKRGHKKMPADEYRRKYDRLMKLLESRKEVA